VGAIVLGALLLRLVVAGIYRNRLSPGEIVKQPASESEYLRRAYIEIGDSQQYLELAKNLRQKLFFSWDGKTPVTFRTPGYPIFLALIDNNPVLLFVLQALFGALTVFFIFLIGAAWFGRRAGIVAAVLMALDLPAIAHTGMVMSETLFVFLLTVACWLFTVAWRKPAPVWGGLSGAVLGIAALTRPIALFAWVPFLVVLALRGRWKHGLLFFLGFVVMCGGWVVRNYRHYQRLGFSSIGGYNLLFYNAAALVADRAQIPFQEAREKLERDYAQNLTTDNPLELAGQLGRVATRLISSDPLRYAKVYLRGLLQIIVGVKSDEIVFRVRGSDLRLANFKDILRAHSLPLMTRLVAVLLAIIELLMTFGAVLGATVGLIKRRDLPVLFWALLGWYFLLAAAPLPDGRFKIPALPFFYLTCGGLIFPGRTTENEPG
jgi:4-amino-4-deoxy-L-arabinose transferase-like glycosyltransferase